MKAKTVNESISFERGSNPKRVLGIGGIIPSKYYEKIQNEARENWKKYLNDTFIGKNVTGIMSQWSTRGHTWENFTVKNIKSIHISNSEFALEDENGEMFSVLSDEKLFIE